MARGRVRTRPVTVPRTGRCPKLWVGQDAGMMRRLKVRSDKLRRLLQNFGFIYNDDGTFTRFHAVVPRKADGSPRFNFHEPPSPQAAGGADE